MNTDWMDDYLRSKTGAIKEFKAEWGVDRYMVGGKMFAMWGGDKEGKAILTLKCEPAFGALLRKAHSDIIPGYYMNKEHWNSVYLEGRVPEDVVRQMMDESYGLIFGSLSKKAQREFSEKAIARQ